MSERSEKKDSRVIVPPELVAEARGGDQAAFAELYALTNTALYRTVRSMVRDEELAWDILQDTYLRAYQSLDKLEADGAFLPWLRRIAVNEAARQTSRSLPLLFSDLESGDEENRVLDIPDPDIDSQPELALDRKETARLLREILAELPEQQQLIIGMHYYQSMSARKIAETLHTSSNNVKVQLYKGRKNVENRVRALEKQGVKLYGLGPIPFLLALLRKLEPARAAEQKAIDAVLSQISAAGKTAAGGAAKAATAGSTAAAADGAVAAGGAAVAAGEAAVNMTAMTAGQARRRSLGVRLLAGGMAFTLIGGGLWAGNRLLRERRSAPEETSETVATEALPVPTQPTGVDEETTPPRPELVGNECGAEGDNLTWRFDYETGTLTIEGSGDMADFIDPDPETDILAPWFTYSDYITAVSLPEGLTVIGANAFSECESLERIVIPEHVTAIGEGAFYNCFSLDSIKLPASISSIGKSAFGGSSIRNGFSVAADNPAYSSDEKGVLFNKERTVLIRCPCDLEGSYSIPETVHTIDEDAFSSCDRLKEIIIPESVTSIGEGAFSNCDGLKEIIIPASVSFIGDGAFLDCRNLTELIIPESVVYLGECAFSFCVLLRSVVLPEGLKTINAGLFYACSALRSVAIPSSVTSIGNGAFRSCSSLSEITIPNSVTSIASEAFENCTALPCVTIPANVRSIGDSIFFIDDFDNMKESGKIYVVPDNPWYSSDENGVLFDKDRSFLICCPGSFEGAYTVPESVTHIGSRAFSNCMNLSEISLPKGLISIGDSAFEYCGKLREINLPENLASIGKEAFAYTGLRTVTIPTSVTYIGEGALSSARGGISVAPDNSAYWIDEKGTLFSKDRTVLYQYSGTSGAYAVPEGVRSIAVSAFASCSELTELSLPESLTSIGNDAFENCGELIAINIPTAVDFIDLDFFTDCDVLQEVLVSPDNPSYSSDEHGVLFNKDQTVLIRMFPGWEGDYAIPEGVTDIGDNAFSSCYDLQTITIPEGVLSIGYSAFDSCDSLEEVSIPDSVRSIGDYAFCNCGSLRRVTILSDDAVIDPETFSECPDLTIQGYPGSTAETYAKVFEIPFLAITP